jgi:hypothetical protein
MKNPLATLCSAIGRSNQYNIEQHKRRWVRRSTKSAILARKNLF